MITLDIDFTRVKPKQNKENNLRFPNSTGLFNLLRTVSAKSDLNMKEFEKIEGKRTPSQMRQILLNERLFL